ncbi:MAG: ornithine cyclodeaminase [Ruminococcaceae bacterium]|nr:ornithine cyclodeaminase [Oscillospiraceae bacterium]
MGKHTQFLYLNEEDMIKAGVLDSARCIDVEEELFGLLSKGDYVMGGDKHNAHGIALKFPKESPFPNMPLDAPDRRFMAMPAYVGGRFNVAGQKWYGSNIINPQRGLPRSILMIMLNDADTCEPIALMSGNLVSSVRTGCVPGVATRYLARKGAKVCTCIGAGPVSKACFEAIALEAKELEEVIICDLFQEKADAFAAEVTQKLHLKARGTTCLEEAVKAADIISVAASSVKPINIPNEWLKAGSLIMFTGRCNIDEPYYLSSKVIWDHAGMHEVYYDEHLLLPENERFINGIGVQIYRMMYEGKLPPITEATSLGDVINGTRPGRESDEERICFVTGGLPVWDVGWSYEIYQNAVKMGLGQTLKLWDEPYLN